MIVHQIPPFGDLCYKNDGPDFKNFLVVGQDELLEGQMRILLSDTLIPKLYLIKLIYHDFTFSFEIPFYPNHIKYILLIFMSLVMIGDFPHIIPNI